MDNNERTFTQAELDQIIMERLRKERAKLTAEAQQREAELNRREQLLTAKEEWSKRGLPVSLLDSLDITKEGALDAAAAVLDGLKKSAPAADNAGGNPEPGTMRFESDPMRNAFGLK